ncbi:MAG: tetratricopeptide repeat protein, partial [Elainella sp. Prado103]|nr:tetratricopeptide repeat protein [Elainella sp. Prado103]
MKKPSRRSRSQTSAPRDRAAGSSPPSSPPRSQHSATPDRLQQIAQLGQSGDLQTAAQRCQQFLQQHPQDATAWHLLSVIRSQQQQWQLALEPIEIALQLVPDRADFLSQAGVVYCGMGQLKRGIAAYQQALQLQPALHHTRFNLGLAWQKLGKIHRAEAAYQDLLDRQPEHAPARLQLGNLAQQQKQFLKAIEHYRQAIQQDAQLTTAWCNLGVALQAIGDLESAKPAFQTALQQNPDYVEAHNGLGAIYEQQEQAETARYHYRQALDRQPDHLPALINWANLHLRLEEFAIAESTLQQILQQQPDRVAALDQQIKLSLLTATWDDWPRQIDRFKRAFQTASTQCSSSPATEDLITPLNSLYLPFSAAEQQVIAQQYVQSLEQRMVDVKQQFQDWVVQHPVDRSHHTKIRLGYVSGDFRYHAVGQLILRLFELHDRQKFAVFAYSLGLNDQSLERQKFERDCDCFREMQGQSVLTIAQQVYQDEIDILIDLAGYTNYACPELFCLQPAPLQINYLGYPGTLGAAYIDYIITDTTIAPPSIAQHFTEQCIYLPETYQLNCYPYPEAVDRVASPNSAFLATNPTDAAILDPIQQELALRSLVSPQQLRQAQGLPSHGFVFCCFNKVQKIEPTMFAVWMRILQQVPQSILWLLSDRPEVETQLRSQAAQQGIQPDRLQFAPRVPKEQHLQRLRAADLFLDTQYYNAHVTASDALWAGVPVLTLQGETFASRVGASLLHAIGLPDLITHSLEEYEQFAVHLATHKTALKAFQHWLGHRRSTCALFNTAQTIRDLESGYALIWQQHQAGLPPVHVHVVRDDIARDDIAVSDALHSNALDNDIANNLDRIDIKHNYIISNDSHDIASNSHCSQRNVSRETIPVSIAAEVSLTARADVGFQNWLHQMQGSLLITTYQAGKILLVGAVDHQITLLARSVQRPMGVAVSG